VSRSRALAALVLLAGGGAALAQPGAPSNAAEAIVQQQVEAYNRGDVAAFTAFYADDAEIFDLGPKTEPVMRGRAAMVPHYRQMFEKYAPQVAITSRMTDGDFVVDHEHVTGKGHSMDGIAVYQVENGKIRRVWFTP
jgi:hypothetical protein